MQSTPLKLNGTIELIMALEKFSNSSLATGGSDCISLSSDHLQLTLYSVSVRYMAE